VCREAERLAPSPCRFAQRFCKSGGLCRGKDEKQGMEWRPTAQGHLTLLVLLSLAFWQHFATVAWLTVKGRPTLPAQKEELWSPPLYPPAKVLWLEKNHKE